jgi:uncharacterized protein (TIGR03083 family)
MQIAPAYDRRLVNVEGPSAVGPVMVRQRRRMVEVFGTLTDEQWATPSRCEGWRVQDVAAHLVSVDGFWHASISGGLSGAPTRFLERDFDPKATPAALVDAARGETPAETLAALQAATGALCDLVEGVDEASWPVIAESPTGHVRLVEVAHHALWDAWVHERDALLPIGLSPAEDPDEIVVSLRYVAALGPTFVLMSGADVRGALVIEATHPAARIVVEVARGGVRVHDGNPPPGALVLRGDAVELTDMLSMRLPFTFDVPADQLWLVRGLAEVFEV